MVFICIRIMHPVGLNHKTRNKQVTIEPNFIEYSYSYMFRPYGIIIRLTFRTCSNKCTNCIVEVSEPLFTVSLTCTMQ
jgi:hypothetical protein